MNTVKLLLAVLITLVLMGCPLPCNTQYKLFGNPAYQACVIEEKAEEQAKDTKKALEDAATMAETQKRLEFDKAQLTK